MYETWYQMTVMLQSGLDITPGDHAPLLAPRLRGGVRGRALGRVRQGDPRLDGRLGGGAVYGTLRDDLVERARRDARGRALQDRARDDDAAGRARRRRADARAAQPLREQLPRPRRPPGDGRGGARGARPLGLRDGLGALHLRHAGAPQRARGAALRVPRHRGHDPLQLLLRRERRPVRGAARRARTRSSPTQLNHASIIDGDPAVQGAAAPLRERRHGRARGAARARPPARATG